MKKMTEAVGDNKSLDNKYVRDYYDKQVGALTETYETSRWHSSVTREFEYRQTDRALDRALSDDLYDKVLEIGPGDGVWTRKLLGHVTGSILLVEQSQEMYNQARNNLADINTINFMHSDFMDAAVEEPKDLIVAMRCFEYFKEKDKALRKIFNILKPRGRVIIVTKNAQLLTATGVQKETLHSDQMSRRQMEILLKKSGFILEDVYPAVMRWKIKYKLMRGVFDLLHRVTVWSKGRIRVPFVTTYATESFVYVATRPH